MKKTWMIATLTLTATLFCAGCGDHTADSSAPADTERIATVTTQSWTTPALSAQDVTDPATLPMHSDITTTPTTISTLSQATDANTEATVTTSLSIGEAELHGDDPYPTFFTYRFSMDSIAVRLSGGNYQVIPCDLSASYDHGLENQYRLEDCNFDSHPDLLVPTQFGNANTAYALFLWNPDTKFFDENSYTLVNPVLHPAQNIISCRTRTNAAMEVLATYTWQNGTIQPVMQYVADYDACTLMAVDLAASDQTPQITTYASIDALETAFDTLCNE